MNEPKLGAATALPAYLGLMLGLFVIGAQSQSRNVIAGIWITEVIAIALPAAFVLCLAGVKLMPYLGLRALTWKHALVAVVAATANQPVVSFLTWAEHETLPRSLVEEFDLQQKMLGTLFAGSNAHWMVLTVVMAAALGEEIFFRGYFFPALRKSWGVAAALLVSGACFSIIHLEWVGFLGLMEIGILLAALRLWSGSLWAAIIGHAVNNAIAGVAFLMHWQEPEDPTPPWVLVLGAAFLIAGVVLLVRVARKPISAEEQQSPPRGAIAGALGAVWIVSFAAGIFAFLKR